MPRAGETGDDSSPRFVSYAAFGEDFFRRAVAPERVLASLDALTGQPIAFGPSGVGPGGLVKIRATGELGAATTSPALDGDVIGYHVELPVALRFAVDLGIETHRFRAGLRVPMRLSARAVEEVKVFIDVTPPQPHEITIDLQARGLRASVLQRVAGVEAEVRRFVAGYVAREIEKPHVRTARLIDVGAAIDSAWERLAPRRPAAALQELSGDLSEALAEEEWQTPQEEGR